VKRIAAVIVAVVAIAVILALASVYMSQGRAKPATPGVPSTIILESPAFSNGSRIPRKYTCDGDDVSPPLRWRNVPTVAYA